MFKNFFHRFIELTPAEGTPANFPKTVVATLTQIYQLDKWRWNLLIGLSTIGAFIEPLIMWLLGKFINLITDGSVPKSEALQHPYFIWIILLFLIALPLLNSIEIAVQNLFVNAKLAQRARFSCHELPDPSVHGFLLE